MGGLSDHRFDRFARVGLKMGPGLRRGTVERLMCRYFARVQSWPWQMKAMQPFIFSRFADCRLTSER